MTRFSTAVAMIIGIAGCSQTGAVPSPQPEKEPIKAKSRLSEHEAIEIAKKAIIARETWAKTGWPKDAKVFVSEKPDGWIINAFPPKASHLLIVINDEGEIVSYQAGW